MFISRETFYLRNSSIRHKAKKIFFLDLLPLGKVFNHFFYRKHCGVALKYFFVAIVFCYCKSLFISWNIFWCLIRAIPRFRKWCRLQIFSCYLNTLILLFSLICMTYQKTKARQISLQTSLVHIRLFDWHPLGFPPAWFIDSSFAYF